MNRKLIKTDPNDAFKLRFDNIYETMEISGRYNILRSEQLTNNGSRASTKEKKSQIDQMKAMCFLLSSDQKRYNLRFKHLRYGEMWEWMNIRHNHSGPVYIDP